MGTRTHGRSDRTRAWWSLALLPPAFLAAFVVGEGLSALYGYDVGGPTPPWPAVLAASVPALLVFCLPAVVTIHFGRRAVAAGEDGAWWPMAVVLVVTGLFLVQNLVGFLLA